MKLHQPSFFAVAAVATLISAASAATAIGWWTFDRDPLLGAPLWESRAIAIYAPWSAIRWWLAWKNDPGFRALFMDGLYMAGGFGMLSALIGLHMLRSFGPLPHVEAEDQPERYGSTEELLESDRISIKKPGIVLGRQNGDVVYHVGDDQVALIGPSRVGEKGVSFVMPTLADCPDSMIVFDPKHELFEATADERAKRGPVFLMDPTRPGTDRYNPLLEIRNDERQIDDCRALGMCMTHGMDRGDPFWSSMAANMAAAIARVVCTDGGPRTLERMRTVQIGIAKGYAPASTDRWALEIIGAHLALPKDRGPRPGIDAQLQLALASAGSPGGARATSRSDFMVGDLAAGDRPVTVYVTLPASQTQALRHMARLIVQGMMLGLLHSTSETSDGRRKKRRVTLLIDEFPQLGKMELIEDSLAVMAGFGVRAFLVCQSVEQIMECYGPNQTVLGNIGTLIWVPGLSDETYKVVTAASGTIIAALRARHRKVGILDRPSETVSQSRHPTINMREARMMGRDHALIVHAGAQPTWLPKCRYYQHPRYAGRIKDTGVRF